MLLLLTPGRLRLAEHGPGIHGVHHPPVHPSVLLLQGGHEEAEDGLNRSEYFIPY